MEKYVIPRSSMLEVYLAKGNFDKCVCNLKAEGLEVTTARQLAEAIILGGPNHPIRKDWSWLAESLNYLPNGDILIASKEFNPLLQYPALATYCHGQNTEFFLDDEIVGPLLEGVKQGGALQLRRNDVPSKVSTDAFGKEPVTSFLFKDKAEEFGQFLGENGIHSVPLNIVDSADAKKCGKAFSRAIWGYFNGEYSALNGYDRIFHCDQGCAFGVRESLRS